MQVLVLSQSDVRELLPMSDCMDVMERALKTLGQGNATQPLRTLMWLPDRRGILGAMPAYLGDIDASGCKLVTVYPGNHGTPYESHQGVVVLFEGKHGSPIAILDGFEVTAIRTAAVSGVATKLLAREDSRDLAILGSGVQARVHLDAMTAARPIERVRVWSRNSEHARAFVYRESARRGLDIEAASTVRAAVEGADIVCTTTAATEPVLEGTWLSPGVHINAVGACTPWARELDSDAVAAARLFVDWRESTFEEAGDYLIPRSEGRFDDGHIRGELGELLLGEATGRSSQEQVTLFKSLGIGIEDVAVAQHVYDQAIAAGVGTAIELGGGT